MTMIDDEHPEWTKMPGQVVHDYLEKYAAKYDLHRRTKFRTKVKSARRDGKGGWNIQTDAGEIFPCDKLLVAYGRTSVPNIPDIPDEGFDVSGSSMHSKNLGSGTKRLSNEMIKDVTVLGASKSAVECCVASLQAGKKVHWVIRDSGSGPPGMIYQNEEEMKKLGKIIFSKLVAQLTPSIYNRSGAWYQLLHSGKTPIGRWLIDQVLEKLPVSSPDYDDSPNMQKLKLKHKWSIFWETAPVVVLDEDSIFFRELFKGENLIVHRGDPVKLSSHTLHLATGEAVPTDFLIYATGWSPYISASIFTEVDQLDLGLAMPLSKVPESDLSHSAVISKRATAEVSHRFPYLTHPPSLPPLPPYHYTPQHLLRHILSPTLAHRRDRSITFVGFSTTVQTAIGSELYALWAVAWMEDLHPPSSPVNKLKTFGELEYEEALERAWAMMRFPATAPRGDVGFLTEIVTFWDTQMRDLGLQVNRQQKGDKDRGWWGWLMSWRGAWWREYLSPYTPGCYRGCVEELLENAKRRREEEEKGVVNGHKAKSA